jgi:BirA family transcriptional regulator, biotin operon repressor / biotin---[acetyl-CoA-carboxylase] ligase
MSDAWQAAARPGRRIGQHIEAHDRIASTNDRARALLDLPDTDGSVVVADEQTAGRGRRGRTWLTPPGSGLALSVALRPRIAAGDAWQLGLAVALAASDACSRISPVGLKWPNDLVAPDGRKVGGILVETVVSGERLEGAVVGVGINVRWPRAEMPAELAARATSLVDLAGRPVDRVALARDLLEHLEDEVAAIEAGSSPIERYRARCTTLGALVVVATADGELRGRAAALDATGSLVIEDAGATTTVTSGEVLAVRRALPA